MNRRKNQQGRSFDSNRNRKFQEGEEGSGGGDGGSSESCVGLCLHMRERGLTYPPPPLHPPCIGVCQHRRQLGIEADKKEEDRLWKRKPCIGLCYLKRVEEQKRRSRKEKNKLEMA